MKKGLDKRDVNRVSKDLNLVKKEISKAVVGQEKVISGLLRAIIANGHVLVEGVPGIAKTLIIRTLSHVTTCKFQRIQFTSDLLPTDILGLTAYDQRKGFYVVKGPIFTNFLLADEINRAPGKTQSALLEAVQEIQVTIGREAFPIEKPFFVLATQNPIETIATYPLPEAQVDRFLFKLLIGYPSKKEEHNILTQNITVKTFDDYKLRGVISSKEIVKMQEMVKKVFINKDVEEYIIRLVEATRYPDKYKLKLGRFIAWGGSPRASIGLHIGAKAEALLNGKSFVTPQHVKDIAYDVLRHRLILNYEGQAEGIKQDDIVKEILSKVPTP